MKKSLIAAAGLAMSGTAFGGAHTAAGGPDWTYIDVGYLVTTSVTDDSDGFSLRGSYEFADKWHVGLQYFDAEFEGGAGGSGGSDADGYELSFGIHPALTDSIDLVLDLGIFDVENDDGLAEVESDGYFVRTGARARVADNFEVWGLVSSRDIDTDGTSDDQKNIAVHTGGQYYWNENVSVGVDVEINTINIANFFLRYSF